MKKIIFIPALANLLMLGNPYSICSQNVGVSGFGLVPDASALLDVDAAGMTPKKGLLIPRITLASVTDKTTITAPANSLLVYNIGTSGLSPAGYYYNQGTTVAANWIPLLTSDVNAPSAWSLKGNTGTTSSIAAIGSTITTGSNFVGTTDTKDFVFATDNKERMRISSTGYIGLGTTAPAAKLELKDVANTELIRLNNSTNSTTSGLYTGAGNPEGVVTANMASIFADQANGRIYKKSTGSGNTGWNEMAGSAHMAKMTRNAAQSISSATITTIAFDNTEFDVGALTHPSSSGDASLDYTFKIVRAGKYLVSLSTRLIGVDLDKNHDIYLEKNGANIRIASDYGHGTGGSPTAMITTVLDLAVGDYLNMDIRHSNVSPATLNTDITNYRPEMSVIELSGTLAGDVVGPASSTDNAIVRFDGTSGKTLQNSGVIIDDANNVTGVASLTVGASLELNITTITGNTLLSDVHNIILANCTGDITITLPVAATNANKIYYIKKTDATGDMVTIDANAAELIDGAANIKLYEQYDYVRIVCDGIGWVTVDGFQELNPMVAEGRLTLTSNTPVTTADITAAGTVYFTPFKGNRIAIFDGSKWYMRKFTQLTVTPPATASRPFDIFIYDDGGNPGTLALEAVIWTNDVTRATALTLQDGVYVKTGETNKRYLGTCRTNASGSQTEDSKTNRFVWNYYNRVRKQMSVADGTNSWTYTTATWHQARASSANQLNFVVGLSEDPLEAIVLARVSNPFASGVMVSIGVGVNSTTTNSAQIHSSGAVGSATPANAFYQGFPIPGYNYLAWLEISDDPGGGNLTTWYGDNGSASWENGISGSGLF